MAERKLMNYLTKAEINKHEIHLTKLPPLALYIHMPWCIKKCPYCDFNSHQLGQKGIPEERYLNCLISDLEQSLALVWGRTIYSIFIGGGTPSLFSGETINQLLMAIRARLPLSPFAEITLEANPGAVDIKYLAEYKKAGITRLSLGIQSFNDRSLKVLGRVHDAALAKAAIISARSYFDNINLDIMYGLPNQTISEALDDLNTALSFNPTHLSCYNLTIEPNTQFFNQPPANLPDNDLCYGMQEQIVTVLLRAGYSRYEISAYAKDTAFRCAHNLNYWQFGDYLGIGAGAHSKISFHDKILRQVRQKHPQNYMNSFDKNMIKSHCLDGNIAVDSGLLAQQEQYNGGHIIENTYVSDVDLPFEFVLNLLRLIDGFELNLFSERCGLSLNVLLPKLQKAIERKFVVLQGNKVVPTRLGQDFLNDLLILFLEDK